MIKNAWISRKFGMVALYNVVIKLPEYCFVDIKYKIIYLYPIYIFFQNLTE